MFSKTFFLTLLVITFIVVVLGENKYSAAANEKIDDDTDFRPHHLKHLQKPFRMAKLNLLWSKAVMRLSDQKLKSIFGELKLHDKEEITWKHLRAQGKDKDGLKEAELRKKLKNIMTNYELIDQLDDLYDEDKTRGFRAMNEASDKYINKSLFKDKKLKKLWEKAETSGFTHDELAALKEEFLHHQEKIDQYYSLLEDVKSANTTDEHEENSIEEKLDRFNQIDLAEEPVPNKDYLGKVNQLREQHRVIKDGYDRLFALAAQGPSSNEFVEPKVQGLWKIALEAKFTPDELESLRVELRHYENRLLKLRHMQAEAALNEEKYEKKLSAAGSKSHGQRMMEDAIKKNARKVEKIHLDIESRILQNHVEL